MALPLVGAGVKAFPVIWKALMALLLGDQVSGMVGGPTLEGLLSEDPEQLMAEHKKKQAGYLNEVQGREVRKALDQKVVSSMMPDPDDLLTLGSLVKSGMFDEELRGSPDALVKTVAAQLGMSPQALASKTTPKDPYTILKGNY